MTTQISPLAHVDSRAEIGNDVEIGPFCFIGPDVRIGDGCRLDSHVSIIGRTTIGSGNRFWPNSVIGGEPQDKSYDGGDETSVLIGDNNQFREGVTVNRGAMKEDGCTRIGNGNLLMSNAHVAHNCHVYDNVILVNGVLLGGHVHVHDRAIVSGNSVVHHFSTIGTLAFVSGGCRVPHDILPYMLAAGSDNPTIKTINIVGMRRNGIPDETIRVIKQAFRLLYREHKTAEFIRQHFHETLHGIIPIELARLLDALDAQRQGRFGRAREARRNVKPDSPGQSAEKHAA
ncbi:MAG: acyl-ACP--UDP-N-acetylglucosamine O-acyltransferase [Maioricimonas sp. JB049]